MKIPRVVMLAVSLGAMLLPAGVAQAQDPSPQCVTRATSIQGLETWLDAQPAPVPLVQLILDALARTQADECVRLNQLQVLGTHNSYHRQPSDPLLSALVAITSTAQAWEYSHLPLDEQFGGQGVRQIELDVFADPNGARYFLRLGPLLSGESILGPLSLLAPGIKVLHVQHLDFETSCLSLVACLGIIRNWSQANPSHLPIMVLVEAKDSPLIEGGSGPIVFDTAQFDALDAEIRSVFDAAQLFTPDDLRAGAATLEEAVLNTGWPTLGALRGRVLFAMDSAGAQRSAYLNGHPSLQGRVMFTNSVPGQDDAAFVKVNDPLADPAQIPALVAAGYLVRTRADTDTEQARSGDTSRRDAALASGAQFVSTDFPQPSLRPGFTDYSVEIPGGNVARCNPVNGPAGCRDGALEP